MAATVRSGPDEAAHIAGQLLAVDGGLAKGALLVMARPKSVDSVGPPGATM